MPRLRVPLVGLLGLVLVAAGCQRAHPYNPSATRRVPSEERSQAELPRDHDWIDTSLVEQEREKEGKTVPLVFVDSRQGDEWSKLPSFWNVPAPAGAGAPPNPAVRIKVPLGLGPLAPHLPAANRPTLAKWELGRRLFHDTTWLTAQGGVSCATCHRPSLAFTDGQARGAAGFNTPTLVNCAYNTRQFWNGRTRYLEEVVQATFDDERSVPAARAHHAWPGVIARLRASDTWVERFAEVFDHLPTRDMVGRSLATYLRSLLAADSLHDRAEQTRRSRKAANLDASHYEAVLDAAALDRLGRGKEDKAAVAGDLLRGYTLFTGKAGCTACHDPGSNGTFTDGRFHNIGAGLEEYTGGNARLRPGRFAVAPLGERSADLIGAWKTPTLRSLLRTGPYFHNGSVDTLEGAVRQHVEQPGSGARFNLHLDPLLRDASGNLLEFDLDAADIRALVLFLRALDGNEVDDAVRSAPAEKDKASR
jgi:cytochrome c peroxidase